MRKRKYTKYSVDMYENRKMKIINTMKERDLICYIWLRLVNLATIVDKDGDLYVTNKMPYSIHTFAIEFDRNEKEIEIALNVLLELEMIVCNNKVYRVKNWTNHQGKRKKKAEEVSQTKEVQENKVVEEKKEDKLSSEEVVEKVQVVEKSVLDNVISIGALKEDIKKDQQVSKSKEIVLDKPPEVNNEAKLIGEDKKVKKKTQRKKKKTRTKKELESEINLSDNYFDYLKENVVMPVDDWKPGPDETVVKEWMFD